MINETAPETKVKNELRIKYDKYVKKYYLIVAACRMKTLSKNDYGAFMRTFSFKPIEEVPLKYHAFIRLLTNEVKEYETSQGIVNTDMVEH